MDKNWDVIVIGGGAAGLMAAGQSALAGNKVLLLEKMNRPGRKLSITGKGRCNITNTAPLAEFTSNIHPNKNFLRSAFTQFFYDELIQFMTEIGVETIIERGGRVFPKSGKAVEVTKKLTEWCKKSGVKIQSHAKVTKVLLTSGVINGVCAQIDNDALELHAPKIILATGGKSYAATGSTGDGYSIAKSLGHSITPPIPCLVPLVPKESIHPSLVGLELKNCEVSLWINNKKKESILGELYFYEKSVGGPVILSLSRKAIPHILNSDVVNIIIDFKPGLDFTKLNNRLTRDFDSNGKDTLKQTLRKLMPLQLIPTCLECTSIPGDKLGNQVTSNDKKNLRNWLKEYKIGIKGYGSFDEAIITAGGIPTKEINQKTMESKKITGLYFAGEVIDLDGPTGGYNLQIAFSTAWVAGQANITEH